MKTFFQVLKEHRVTLMQQESYFHGKKLAHYRQIRTDWIEKHSFEKTPLLCHPLENNFFVKVKNKIRSL